MSDRFIVQEIAGIAERLSRLTAALADEGEPADGVLPPARPSDADTERRRQSDLLAMARLWLRARAAKEAFFDLDLFHDPAWNILLDLYVSHRERRDVSVTSACIASGAPMTTALRWIAVLRERGLVSREADPSDQRRAYLRVTDDGIARMERTLGRFIAGDRVAAAAPGLRFAH